MVKKLHCKLLNRPLIINYIYYYCILQLRTSRFPDRMVPVHSNGRLRYLTKKTINSIICVYVYIILNQAVLVETIILVFRRGNGTSYNA